MAFFWKPHVTWAGLGPATVGTQEDAAPKRLQAIGTVLKFKHLKALKILNEKVQSQAGLFFTPDD